MAILGLIGTESFNTNRFKSARRKVFYDYPNGAAPLVGLTSMLKEERCSDPEFNWFEKRWVGGLTSTSSGGTAPWYGSGATTDNSWGTVERTTNPINITQGQKLTIRVADGTTLRVGNVIRLKQVVVTAGGPYDIQFRIAAMTVATGTQYYLDCYVLQTPASTPTLANNTTKEVLAIGSANSQGARSQGTVGYTLPVNPSNVTQIFRTPFTITRTAMKTSAKYDPTGVWKDRSKEASVTHMTEMEYAFFFGQRYADLTGVTDGASGQPVYYTAGIYQFLQSWEAAGADATYVDFPDYRGASAAAVTLLTDSAKRIIAPTGGILTEKDYDNYLERAFRTTMSSDNSKLVFCGNTFLNVINQMYKNKSTLDTNLPLTETYGMDVVRHRCPFGTIFYKTHPLFNLNANLLGSAVVMDVGNILYRYIDDTDLLENRQENDADYRKDEWLTECGLEFRYPESFMWFDGVSDFAP